jgi:hypothetical protein
VEKYLVGLKMLEVGQSSLVDKCLQEMMESMEVVVRKTRIERQPIRHLRLV